MNSYRDLYRRSIDDPENFWKIEAERIYWEIPPQKILDFSNPPFTKWFSGGQTNICYNAVDRHANDRPQQAALICISTETNEEKLYSYSELYREVNCFAAVLQDLGVKNGDRVIIYMPMIAEAIFAMLACVRIGAIHSVVFGGFAPTNLAVRINDAKPKLLITADAGMRNGTPIPYKDLVDTAISNTKFPPDKVLICNRMLVPIVMHTTRDIDYSTLRANYLNTIVPVSWLESNMPSYILYTSGTTGTPKGVQRDTGGYAVALATTMQYLYCIQPGEVIFTTSDIGWIVGHSYIVYAPLIIGATTILYEGLPTQPDPGIWWKIIQDYNVVSMLSSPTAMRLLKSYDKTYINKYNIQSLRHVFLAGEPLDEPTSKWAHTCLNVPVFDHYWQTETGWPVLTYLPGVELISNRFGSPGFPNLGYKVKVFDETTGIELQAGNKGVLVIVPPLPPGNLSTLWGDNERFLKTYYSSFKNLVYNSFDWVEFDQDGYFFIMGRTDDVINVSGHRLGTREIEEAIQYHPAVAEAAVVGMTDSLKGQVPIGFVRLKNVNNFPQENLSRVEKEIIKKVSDILGSIAKPQKIHFVKAIPKTRSGKILRRTIQSIVEGRIIGDGDYTIVEDKSAIEEIKNTIK